jgi:dTDP-4-dehydrorhamnose 3,5-epimerase
MSSKRFDMIPMPLAGLVTLQRLPLQDARGYLERMYCRDELHGILGERTICQINRTHNVLAGTVRGMHYQLPPHAECKIISCLRGAIFDVAIDLRRNSPSFLQWHGEVLSAENHRTLVIPEGFAHGFQTLVDDTEILYFSTAAYTPSAERVINACDPRVGIAWPKPITCMSDKDRNQALLQDGCTIGI